MTKPVSVVWSPQAKNDLKNIFEWIKKTTQSLQDAVSTRTDIINKSKQIVFVGQYQVEELLGEPFRRIIVRHYKIVYKAESKSQIRILKVFDTYKHPDSIKKGGLG